MCGYLKQQNVLDDDAKKEKKMLAPYNVRRSSGYLGLIVGGEPPEHFHIDVWKSNPSKKRPKITSNREEIEAIVEKFDGDVLYLRAFGVYVVPFVALPVEGLIRSTVLELRDEEFTIKQTGGMFTFLGAPIRKIAWTLSDDANDAEITVDLIREATISPTCVMEQLAILDSGFETFVLGKTANGKS